MKLSHGPIIISLLAATTTDAWSCGPGGSRYGVVLKQVPTTPSLLLETFPSELQQMRRRRQEFLNRAFTRISPPYSITETDAEIQISIDVPGVKAQDVQVTLEDNGKVLTVTGRREQETTTGNSNTSSSSKFSQSFTMDPTVDIDQFKANLQNGVLVITAPKDLQRLEQNIRRIPITTDIADVESSPLTNVDASAEKAKDVDDDAAADAVSA